MTRKSRDLIPSTGSEAGGPLWRTNEQVVAVRRNGAARPHTPAGRRLLRVLVVDDDRDTTDSLCMLVQLWGHDVRPAYDGATALTIAAAYQPDVVLLDLAMPTMHGSQVARQLRRQPRFKSTLLVAVTGYTDEAHRLSTEDAGFDLFLIKPVEPSTLEELMLLEQGRRIDAPSPPATARTYGLLVVDDEESVRDVLNGWMRLHGFAVWLAANGHEALDLYRRHGADIDVVLLDVRMSGLDGPHTLAALRDLDPQVCGCFMSGGLGNYTAEALRDLSPAAIFPKPFQLPEVTRVIRELAGKAAREPCSV